MYTDSTTIKDLALAIHENAINHGWWENRRELTETIALIHSEWSEALEEDRAGRPLVWKKNEYGKIITPDTPNFGNYYAEHKPEGTAVELIDGCIRILDVIAHTLSREKLADRIWISIERDIAAYDDLHINRFDLPYSRKRPLPYLVSQLHYSTSMAWYNDDVLALRHCITRVFAWIMTRGYNPLALMMEKHEYNTKRPYKHGKLY